MKTILFKQYTCPFCNYKGRHFNIIGNSYPIFEEKQIIPSGRRKEGCPNCGSSDRERLVYIYLLKEERIFRNNLTILHIAPERNLGRELHKHYKDNYFAGDLHMDGYSYPDHVKNLNIIDLPFEDNFFDLVICNHVLEHVNEEQKALHEIYRVLKPNCEAVLQVPLSANSKETFEDPAITSPEDKIKWYCQFDHVRLYGQDYPERLKKGGFKVKRLNISKKYQKYRLNLKEDIFLGKK